MPEACNLCGGDNSARMAHLHGRDLLRCINCGIRWYNPLPTHEELKGLYAANEYVGSEYFNLETELHTNHFQHMSRAAAIAAQRFPNAGRVLEIGPGVGHFLELCAAGGLEIEAIEFSAPLAQAIRSRFGCPVREEPLEVCALPAASYQVVAAFDLLEHVRDPMTLLREIWRILAPGGLLFLSTISTDNLLDRVGLLFHRLGLPGPLAKLHPPYHLYYFNRANILDYIKQSGFMMESFLQENYDSRKATPSIAARLVLDSIYIVHNLTGLKTNFYITCRKIDRP